VLNEALGICQSLHQAGFKLPVAANLSPANLQHDHLSNRSTARWKV
jgi:hypothetical protein